MSDSVALGGGHRALPLALRGHSSHPLCICNWFWVYVTEYQGGGFGSLRFGSGAVPLRSDGQPHQHTLTGKIFFTLTLSKIAAYTYL